MQTWDFNQIHPAMDVRDRGGEKIGTVDQVHYNEPATVGGDGGAARLPANGLIEVKTGFLGLGRRLYVPLSEVDDVLSDSVFLSRTRDDLDDPAWQERPASLDQPPH
jgi:hypothetical protein